MSNAKAVVLVVEDDALIRMCVVELVESAGFEALEADSADEAIRILEMRPDVHLVFTDVQMPGTMDGVKLAHYTTS
jgi:CheY-like chemotaxis protein